MRPIKFTIHYEFDLWRDRFIYIGAIICLLQLKKNITKKNIIREIKRCVDITGFLEDIDEETTYEIFGINDNCKEKHYEKALLIYTKLRGKQK